MGFEIFTWMRAIEHAGMSIGARSCAFSLVTYLDRAGRCYPRRGSIALASGSNDRSVRRWLVELEDAGFITRDVRYIIASFPPESGPYGPHEDSTVRVDSGPYSPDADTGVRIDTRTQESAGHYGPDTRTQESGGRTVQSPITTQLTTQPTTQESQSARGANHVREMDDEKPASQTVATAEVVDDRPDLMLDLLSAFQNDSEPQPLPPVTPEPEKRVSVAPVESTHETLDVWISREFAKWERAINPQVGVTIAAACMGVGMDESAIRQYVAERLAEFATDNTSTRIVTRAMMQDAGKFKERANQPAFAPRGAKRESTRATYQHTRLNPVDDLPLAWEYDGPEAFKIAADEWISVVEAAGLDWRKKHNWDATERAWSGRFKDEC